MSFQLAIRFIWRAMFLMVWKRSRRRACSILLVLRGVITWPLTKKFSTELCRVPAVTKQLIKNRRLIPSAPPRPAAQLFRACDESRLVAAPLPHQSAEELLSRLV